MTICRVCKKLLPAGRYCEAHAGAAAQEVNNRLKHLASNYKGKRVGFYNSAAWHRFSREVLIERPVCENCRQAPAKEVHHTRYDAPLDATTVLALCPACHREYFGTRKKQKNEPDRGSFGGN